MRSALKLEFENGPIDYLCVNPDMTQTVIYREDNSIVTLIRLTAEQTRQLRNVLAENEKWNHK